MKAIPPSSSPSFIKFSPSENEDGKEIYLFNFASRKLGEGEESDTFIFTFIFASRKLGV